jgi:hypothetical protein
MLGGMLVAETFLYHLYFYSIDSIPPPKKYYYQYLIYGNHKPAGRIA